MIKIDMKQNKKSSLVNRLRTITNKIYLFILLLILMIISSLAIGKRISWIPRAQELKKITVVNLTTPDMTKDKVDNLVAQAKLAEGIRLTQFDIDNLMFYLSPHSKYLSSISLFLQEDQNIKATLFFRNSIFNNIDLTASVGITNNLPSIKIKEIKIGIIPVPSFLWEGYASKLEQRAKGYVVKNKFTINKLAINKDDVIFSGNIPGSFVDPLFWERQSLRIEKAISRFGL